MKHTVQIIIDSPSYIIYQKHLFVRGRQVLLVAHESVWHQNVLRGTPD